MTNGKLRVVILGGGFGGMYAALEFERALERGADVDATLVNPDNFSLFTPMLHEVAASDLDIANIVSPIRELLRRVTFFMARSKPSISSVNASECHTDTRTIATRCHTTAWCWPSAPPRTSTTFLA